MPEDHDSTRRMLLTALTGLTFAHVKITPALAARTENNPTTRVAWFSRSGNTRVIAGVITAVFKIVLAHDNARCQ